LALLQGSEPKIAADLIGIRIGLRKPFEDIAVCANAGADGPGCSGYWASKKHALFAPAYLNAYAANGAVITGRLVI
jgi:hypothetical protein